MGSYAELHCKTNFSFLCGASHPDELVAQAAQLGLAGLAVTDQNSLAGVVRAHVAAKAAGLKLVIGAEIIPEDAPPVLLYAPDLAAYKRLSSLISRGRRRAEKGHCRLTFADIAEHSEGLIAALIFARNAEPRVPSPPGTPGGEGQGEGGHHAARRENASTGREGTISPQDDETPHPDPLPLSTGGEGTSGSPRLSSHTREIEAHSGGESRAAGVPSPPGTPGGEGQGEGGHHAARGESASAGWEGTISPQDDEPPHPNPLPLSTGGEGTSGLPRFSSHTRERTYQDLFPGRCYLAIALHHGPNDARALEMAAAFARRERLPLLATNDVHYHLPERRPLHDVLTAIRHLTTVAELGELRFPNGELYLKAASQMAELFRAHPEALAHTVEIADRCTFSLDELRYEYPEELAPPGSTPFEHLTRLTWAGARDRYPAGVPNKVRSQLERELALIEELRYEAFFLTVWDLVVFARGRGILCQGRGSAANSAVCYCIGITSVDPDRTDLLFERFISRERNEAPDIDVDFEHERREEVIQYIYQKYGRDRAALVAEVISYRPRSAVRDVGKALGLSLDCVDRMAKSFDPYAEASEMDGRARGAGLDPRAPEVQRFTRLATEILGFPRHLSQHVGGFVITKGPLAELTPIENAAMAERTVIQWDKDDVDALGILKVDCLSLGMLTAIRKCFDLVARHYDCQLTLATIPAEDPATYDMICEADTVGVFQIESRAQMSMLPRLQPRNFYDLVIEVAIVRPGPIQGKMVHPYLRRRSGEEPVTYPDPVVEQVLAKTLGVPLFQEQVMRLAMVAAGFTPGEADELRRAMGAWRKTGLIEKFRVKVRDGMLARGLPAEFADQLFEQIRGFGSYGFPEAHAASFALLAYVSAWLKRHYPAAFTVAILNSQPMGFYAPAQLVRDLQAHGGEVLPVDVTHSEWDSLLEATEETGTVRLGFRLIRGFPEASAPSIIAARAEAPFRSMNDFARRTALGRPLIARLAAADAFRSIGVDRRQALWQVLSLGEELPLFAGLDDDTAAVPVGLPEMPIEKHLVADFDSTGLSLKAHPIGLVRPGLDDLQVLPATRLTDLADKTPVRVAGLVIVRQMPSTAKGTIFMTLEDETGNANIVLWPRVWERFRQSVYGAVALMVEGRLERSGRVMHVIASHLEDLSHSLKGIGKRSRDFH